MSFFTRVMALLMLAFWVSAISVCARECAKFAQEDLCCPASGGHDSDRPASSDNSCLFSVALTKVHDEERVAWDFSLLAAIVPVLFSLAPDTELLWQPASPDFAQTLAQKWQFITRTALPPRAPSSLS